VEKRAQVVARIKIRTGKMCFLGTGTKEWRNWTVNRNLLTQTDKKRRRPAIEMTEGGTCGMVFELSAITVSRAENPAHSISAIDRVR
jgi:hypothetical protein